MKYSRKSRKRLRQVSGIINLIEMSTYRLACGDSELCGILRGLDDSFSQTRNLSTY